MRLENQVQMVQVFCLSCVVCDPRGGAQGTALHSPYGHDRSGFDINHSEHYILLSHRSAIAPENAHYR